MLMCHDLVSGKCAYGLGAKVAVQNALFGGAWRRHVRAQERDAREPGALGLYRLGSVVSV